MKDRLYIFWKGSFQKLSNSKYFPHGEIPISYDNLNVFHYIINAVKSSAFLGVCILFSLSVTSVGLRLYLSSILGKVAQYSLDKNVHDIKMTMIVMLFVWLSIPVVQVLSFLFNMFVSQNLRISVLNHLTSRLYYGDVRSLEQNNVGNLVERIEVASASVPSVVSNTSGTLIKLVSILILVPSMLSEFSLAMTLFVGLWMLSAIFSSAFLAYSGLKLVEQSSNVHAKLISEITESLLKIPIIYKFGSYKFEINRLKGYSKKDLESCRNVRTYWLFVQVIETFYKWVFGFCFIIYSFYLFQIGDVTIPDLITLMTLMIIISWEFESIAFHFVDLFDSLGSLKASLGEIKRIPILIVEKKLPKIRSDSEHINLKGVEVKVGSKTLLKNISLSIRAGEKVAVVGFSGSGKSTLLNVITGIVSPSKGQVLIYGNGLIDRDKTSAFFPISTSDHSAILFNRTVLDNIAYMASDLNEERLGKAIEISKSLSLIKKSSQGLYETIEENGTGLSTGEKQRISIARALYRHSDMILFDEATSGIDVVLEEQIIKDILKHEKRRTIISVTHRIPSIKSFDKIIVMDHGNIISVGSHNQLLKKSSIYRKLMGDND